MYLSLQRLYEKYTYDEYKQWLYVENYTMIFLMALLGKFNRIEVFQLNFHEMCRFMINLYQEQMGIFQFHTKNIRRIKNNDVIKYDGRYYTLHAQIFEGILHCDSPAKNRKTKSWFLYSPLNSNIWTFTFSVFGFKNCYGFSLSFEFGTEKKR